MTLSVHFRLRLNQNQDTPKKISDKPASIRYHVSINGEMDVPFSTGYKIEPSQWNQQTETIETNGDKSTYYSAVNQLLNNIRGELFELFVLLKHHEEDINARLLIKEYKSSKKKTPKLIQLYEDYLKEMETRIGKRGKDAVEQRTYDKWLNAKKNLAVFIKVKFNRADIDLKEIKLKHAGEFVTFMESKVNMQGNNVTHKYAYRT